MRKKTTRKIGRTADFSRARCLEDFSRGFFLALRPRDLKMRLLVGYMFDVIIIENAVLVRFSSIHHSKQMERDQGHDKSINQSLY